MNRDRVEKIKVSLPRILKKFHKQKQLGKPLYVESYRIMAATTEVIKMQLGANQEEAEYSATAYYSCLSEMITSQGTNNIEAISYCYSAVISMLDLGVINHQQNKILKIAEHLITKCPAMAMKYGIICLQFILHAKSESQWNSDANTGLILKAMLDQCVNTQKDIV
jgi:hypothetical protein